MWACLVRYLITLSLEEKGTAVVAEIEVSVNCQGEYGYPYWEGFHLLMNIR